MNAAQQIEYQFPEKLGFLFERRKWRYKIAYGGRDGAKSHSFAGALVLMGAEEPLRIGCFREVQKSIKDSVHQLLSDKIAEYNLGGFYKILQNEIVAPNGTAFGFSGLAQHTLYSIKSWEGLDIAWVEEAQSVAKRSWKILIPTIRKDGSEIWGSFNPEMDTDDTYQRFVINPPPDAKVVQINYTDNPWASKALDSDRAHLKAKDERDGTNEFGETYLGHCKAAVDGAIYYKEVSRLRSEGRLHAVPYDPMLKVHVVVDLGYNDYMSLLLVQRLASEIRVIRYIEDRQRDIPSYSAELKEFKLNWGDVWLPHDAKATTVTSASNPIGATAEEQFRNLGWSTQITPNIPKDHGIQKARAVFHRVHIDRENAVELVNRLGRYRRRVVLDKKTGATIATEPVHDDESHGADGFRYLALVADQMTNDSDDGWNKKLKYSNQGYV